ncbi:MAG: four helix bundle protein [Candidatus Delongbacteria bacterium]|nr:four helix bundle protein [Candidatus Delongbacteria bacterium]
MVIEDKSLDFAVNIVELYKYLIYDKKEFVLSKQILRSGTSIGANIKESRHAESDADFIHKLAISQKEAGETEYWLILLHRTDYITKSKYEAVNKELQQLRKMLSSSILTMKQKKRVK